MFSRRFHRLPVNLGAVLITEEVNVPCTVDNISEGGLHIRVTVKTSSDLLNVSFVRLELQVPRDENHESIEKVIILTCEIMWVEKEHPDKGFSLGLRLLDENPSYQNLVKALYIKNAGIL